MRAIQPAPGIFYASCLDLLLDCILSNLHQVGHLSSHVHCAMAHCCT